MPQNGLAFCLTNSILDASLRQQNPCTKFLHERSNFLALQVAIETVAEQSTLAYLPKNHEPSFTHPHSLQILTLYRKGAQCLTLTHATENVCNYLVTSYYTATYTHAMLTMSYQGARSWQLTCRPSISMSS